MKLNEFDYYLPEELIAQHPLKQRDSSKMLVLNKDSGTIEHKNFNNFIDYLKVNDCLVINNTKVIPARLYGVKENTGAKIEVVLLKQLDEKDCWEALVKPGKKLRIGTNIVFGQGKLIGEVIETTQVGGRIIKFKYQGIFNEILDELGQMPLPPYITEQLEEQDRYQTVYAQHSGSAAAPTAGLHFTPEILEKIKSKNIEVVEILLHVGLGTFRPVKVDDIKEHVMHPEYYQVPEEAALKLNKALKENRRIIAVGTTSTRTLETVGKSGQIVAGQGWTDIFIYPGYEFKIVDALLTNFHLPKSTLIMLVSALSSRKNVLDAYQEAVEKKYRFFSFGDAMLII